MGSKKAACASGRPRRLRAPKGRDPPPVLRRLRSSPRRAWRPRRSANLPELWFDLAGTLVQDPRVGPTAIRRKRPATYADIEALPDHLIGEIIGGELIVSPRPSPLHVLATSALGDELVGPFQKGRGGPGGWWILDAPELHIGGEVLVPDLAGWRRERMPTLPDTAWFAVVPDWLCEVRSPSTGLVDRVQKLPIYRAAGVRHAWILDPDAQTLEVYRSDPSGWVLIATAGGASRVRVEPFEAVAIDLSTLWASGARETQ